MSDSLPDYYRHLAAQNDEASTSPSGPSTPAASEDAEAPPRPFRADAFRLQLPDGDWKDRSVYTITGPTSDGIQHNITVTLDPEVEADTLYDFAAEQIAALELSLERCRVLMDDEIELDGGLPAYRAIYVWYPKDDLRLYQEQIYVLHDGCGYTLTASFTRATRKQFGPEVERMMRSFRPVAASRDGAG